MARKTDSKSSKSGSKSRSSDMEHSAQMTTDHDEIRRWAEERGGRPSVVRTGQQGGGILRFDFGEDDEKLEETSWEEFFQIFEDSNLALLHQDEIGSGQTSRFFKFVARGATAGGSKKASGTRRTSARRAASGSAKRGSAKAASKSRGGAGASKRTAFGASKSTSKGLVGICVL